MSVDINGTTIRMTRGDTLKVYVTPSYKDGTPYEPIQGDRIRFALKHKIDDEEPIILREIPIDTLLLHVLPEETKGLSYGTYVYDIEITYANGDVDTFITKAPFKLTEEVD